MRTLQLFISVLLVSCASQSTKNNSKYHDSLSNGLRIVHTLDSPFYYKDQVGTVSLKEGYQICYAEDDSSRYLYLKRGDSLHLLNKTTTYTSFYHLGKLSEDGDSYFILGHDQGNGSPYSYEFIDKTSGKNILGYGVEFLSVFNLKDEMFILYLDTIIRDSLYKLALLNIKSKSKEYFDLPDDMTGYSQISISALTPAKMIIEYNIDENGELMKRKMYSRKHETVQKNK